jgi:hypothetical protein
MRPTVAWLALLAPLLGCVEASEPYAPAAESDDTQLASQEAQEDASTAADVGVAPADPWNPSPRTTDDAGLPLPACFSPENVEQRFLFNARIQGCACSESDASSEGLCVNGVALLCYRGRWLAGLDGPCLPRDWGRRDAGADVGACFSPSENTLRNDVPGCACQETIINRNGFCVDAQALVCDRGAWRRVIDGPCFPPGTISEQTCAARGGEALTARSEPLHLIWLDQQLCPEGRALLGAVTRPLLDDGGVEIGLLGQAPCCARP